MTATRLPKARPRVPPVPSRKRAWVSSGAEKFNAHRAVITPVLTPIIPIALPTLAVACDANPVIPPIQQSDAAKYPI